jgi:hypothetical membrane protein
MLIKYLGILNVIVFTLGVTVLIGKARGFSIKKQTISDLASYKPVGNIFNILLFVFSFNQLLFSSIVCNHFNNIHSNISKLMFVVGSMFLCLGAYYSAKKNRSLHELFVTVCGICVTCGVLIIAYLVLMQNMAIGLILFGQCLGILVSYLTRKLIQGGLWEIPLFLIVYSWNIVLSYYVLM